MAGGYREAVAVSVNTPSPSGWQHKALSAAVAVLGVALAAHEAWILLASVIPAVVVFVVIGFIVRLLRGRRW